MSSYSHRDYEQRTSGYGRRRRKAAGFNKKSRASSAAKGIVALAVVVGAVGLLYLFADNIRPFVESIGGGKATPDEPDIPTAAVVNDTADTPEQPVEIPLAEGAFDEVDGSIFVSDGAGYVRFKGIDTTAKNYAAVLNSVSRSISQKIKLYSVVIPTNTEIGLDGRLDGSYSQRDNLDVIASSLSDQVQSVDVYEALSEHKGEYLYYNSDPLMTSKGAYYAYIKTAEAVGVDMKRVYTMETLSEKMGTISPFEGEYLVRTKDAKKQPNGNEDIFANPDTIEYYKLPVHYDCFAIDEKTGDRTETDLFSEKSAIRDPLSIFPAKDTPLLYVYNLQSSNTDKLLIVKDHAAEPMLGYIIPNFGEIYIADVSLCKSNLRELSNEYGVTHIMFVEGIDDANNSLYCQRLRDLFDNSISD